MYLEITDIVSHQPADIPLVFGTHWEFRGNSTELEWETSYSMEGASAIDRSNQASFFQLMQPHPSTTHPNPTQSNPNELTPPLSKKQVSGSP
jgi:hypothetical protein